MRIDCRSTVLLLAFALAGCSSTKGTPTGLVLDATLPLDGVVVRVEDRSARPVLSLFDPRTGKQSAQAWETALWQLSPDGTHLLLIDADWHVTGQPLSKSMRFARDAAGAPTLEVVHTFNERGTRWKPGPDRLAALGDRVYGDGRWHTLDGARSLECGGGVVSPDGRHHASVCAGVTLVFDDFTELVKLAAAPVQFTEDGQWLVLAGHQSAFHIPSRTLVDDYRRVALGRPTLASTSTWPMRGMRSRGSPRRRRRTCACSRASSSASVDGSSSSRLYRRKKAAAAGSRSP